MFAVPLMVVFYAVAAFLASVIAGFGFRLDGNWPVAAWDGDRTQTLRTMWAVNMARGIAVVKVAAPRSTF